MTIHKAQGATLARALVLTDDTMTAEHAYTALSRASIRTDLYIESSDALEREAHAPTVSTPTAERVSQCDPALRRPVARHRPNPATRPDRRVASRATNASNTSSSAGHQTTASSYASCNSASARCGGTLEHASLAAA